MFNFFKAFHFTSGFSVSAEPITLPLPRYVCMTPVTHLKRKVVSQPHVKRGQALSRCFVLEKVLLFQALTPVVSSPLGVMPELCEVYDYLSEKHLSSGGREMSLANSEKWTLYLFFIYSRVISLESVLFPGMYQTDLQRPHFPENIQFSSVHFSRSAVSNSLRPHGLQHARLPYPSPTFGACSNSCPLSW